MYFSGQDIAQDHKQAVFWYQKAADQGYAAAQYNLGVMCYEGKGVAQDYVEAHKWFNLAGANGFANAIKPRDVVERQMSRKQIAEAQLRASE